jgi:hypothetical protein
MPDEEKKEQAAAAPPTNAAPTGEETAAIKAQLDEEKKAKAAAVAALATRDAQLAALQTSLSEAKTASAAAAAELTLAKQAQTKAVSKYLDAVKLANPAIPGDVITGSTIDEIDASLAKATTIAGAVKANIEAQAKEGKVPAGAPPRGEISTEGLSPREKIAAGVKQKEGGTS